MHDRGSIPTHGHVALASVVGAPDFVLPWLDRFYDDDDAVLVLSAADGSLPLDGAERAVRRGMLDRDEAGAYAPASLHKRLEIWALFEGWKDVPRDVRRRLVEWDLGHYEASIQAEVEAVRDRATSEVADRPPSKLPGPQAEAPGSAGEPGQADYAYVLLEEAEAIIAARDHLYLWPCNCRATVGACRKPVNVCLRFDNDRDLGWEISPERATEILHAADRAGLMHTADFGGDPETSGAICNCCTDCCYPHLATVRLGTSDVWPVRRHVAFVHTGRCTDCGRCVRRCPFGAMTAGDGAPRLEPSACRGCGLCATGCTSDAVEMLPARS